MYCAFLFLLLTAASGLTFGTSLPESRDACYFVRPNENDFTKRIKALPELQKLEKSLAPELHIAFGSSEMNVTAIHQGKCYLSVPVYVDHGDRLELWHIFLTDHLGKITYIQNLEGEYVSLTAWRLQQIGNK